MISLLRRFLRVFYAVSIWKAAADRIGVIWIRRSVSLATNDLDGRHLPGSEATIMEESALITPLGQVG